jgi:hypothetical protein
MAGKHNTWSGPLDRHTIDSLMRQITARQIQHLENWGFGVKGMNERTISNKVNGGTFSALFFVQCMEAIGAKNVHLNGA